MFVAQAAAGGTKIERYQELREQAASLFSAESDGLANAANLTALLYEALPDLNWVGFYFFRDRELVLGPFQGKVACVRIALGRGVCGTAALRREPVVVPDVHEFPGHIACDAASRSEIVLPVLRGNELLGVLDLDSPELARFDHEDALGLGALVELFVAHSDLTRLV